MSHQKNNAQYSKDGYRTKSPKKRVSPKKRSSPKQSPKKQSSKNDDDKTRIENFKTIDNFTKTTESKQDQISKDKEELKKKFEGFLLIPKEDYKCIQPNTFIRYLKDGKLYRSGGILKLNKAPKYWLLQSADKRNKIRWSVPLENTKNVYYQKDMDALRREAKNKDKLYKAVMNNEFVVIPKDAFERLRILEEEEKVRKERQEGGGQDESSYTDYTSYTDDDDESSVMIDLKFQKRVI
jgi:hypothetical protein